MPERDVPDESSSISHEVAELARMVTRAGKCVVLTGAGISTESGIPDFRSPGTGLWTQVDPMEVLSATAFRTKPEAFYQFILKLCEALQAASPNDGHRALARLEEMGLVDVLVTQNIDGLHQRAGSRNVLEVHGHLRTGTCVKCGRSHDMGGVLDAVRRRELPRCSACDGMIKPDVVLFEDPLPVDFVLAQQAVMESDLLIAVGSSLEVAPVCYLPALASHLAIVNLMPTGYDSRAEVVIHDKAGRALVALLDAVRLGSDGNGHSEQDISRNGGSGIE
ncbi:MAG: SIR2 family NAD-dependent protein deacylase [Bacteroidota bacterium]